jgi:hypothetical protein
MRRASLIYRATESVPGQLCFDVGANVGYYFDELGLQAIPLTGQKDPLGDRGVVHLAWK